ncbi:hypothetical protein HMPREF1979_00931 [Actinomyces johnsonii F0542]|uniref:Uncharacterized protein n=2 Tax=Actinomyces johnsonii TaxID=544581 RepID=U1S2S9_9ACTO|nr:hypothetical protein HMPREF1549_00491 [Actinomyces johnsonii F0510]ERH24942.1 hypothetical protein HMPREF1979_00931 [Actinomyces johnsonii F0542]
MEPRAAKDWGASPGEADVDESSDGLPSAGGIDVIAASSHR